MYSTRVLHRGSFILWQRLAFAAMVMSGRLLVADDQAPPASDGYKTVNADGDGKIPIRVREEPDALAHAHLTDPLDHQRAFSATNPLANKSYSYTADAVQGGNDYNRKSDQNSFITKPYGFAPGASTVPGLDAKASYPAAALSNRSAPDIGKSFATSSADVSQNQASTFASTKSSDQDRSAILGGQTTKTQASPMGDKVFNGDEAKSAKRGLTRLKNGQLYVHDLPNRPLTIDEVRNLINHGFKPDTDAKPADDESKPLNDPGYVPQPVREMPDVAAPAGPVSEEDKDDPVPSPGMMSSKPPPENSQSLPQR